VFNILAPVFCFLSAEFVMLEYSGVCTMSCYNYAVLQNYVLFVILQRKIDRTKVENDPDIVIEEGSICVKSDDIDVSKKETGLEVSLFLCLTLGSHAVPVW
jgi:hypothetical protein